MPGLVDAHCHVGLDAHGARATRRRPRQQAVADRDAGALLLRDCGSAGRHVLDPRPRRPAPADPRRAATSPAPGATSATTPTRSSPRTSRRTSSQEAQRGDGWVKLVGDWIARDAGDLAPSFPPEAFAAAIEAAHEHGARVTAHCFGETVLPDLIEAGIDCIEHGTGLTTDLIDTMVARGTALVPTVVQLNNFPEYAAAGEEQVPGVRRPHARPVRPPPRDDHVRPTRRACRSTPAPTPGECCRTA